MTTVAAALAVSASGASSGPEPSPGGSASEADTGSQCFGAPARDLDSSCSRRPRRTVVPQPREARGAPNSPCEPARPRTHLNVCAFGVPRADASATVALLGDSHAAHWRAAVDVMARAKGWHGVSITRAGCPFSTATRVLPRALRARCIRRNRAVPRWFSEHPEVSTVFVSGLSGAEWKLGRVQDPFEAEVDHYLRAWESLPPSVTRVVVIRDTPKVDSGSGRCVERAVARGEPAGRECAVSRVRAVDRDAAVVAAARARSPRLLSVDLTDRFCGPRWCYPVIGGALVHKDEHHLVADFVETLGPYLLREVDQVMAPAR